MRFDTGTVHDYETAEHYLEAGRDPADRPFGHNTRLVRVAADAIGVKYHATVILVWRADGTIVIDTDGWHTVTTAVRLNALLPAGWRIGSERGRWYLYRANGRMVDVRFGATFTRWEKIRFTDGTEIRPDGTLGNVPAADVLEAQETAERATERAIGRYVRGFVRALRADALPVPGNGDCWLCAMRGTPTRANGVMTMTASPNGNGVPWGDAAGNTEHLAEHLRESYYVPALAVNAMAERGYNPAVWLSTSSTGHLSTAFAGDGATVGRAIRRYLKARLLPELAR